MSRNSSLSSTAVNVSFCPYNEHNIKLAMKSNKQWKYGPTFCQLKANLQSFTAVDDKLEFRLISFGSSVTAGAYCDGCRPCIDCDHVALTPERLTRNCTFTSYLHQWLQSQTTSK